MNDYSLKANSLDGFTSFQTDKSIVSKQRLDCLICNHQIDPNDKSAFATFTCNVRAFRGEKFRVWRCPGCMTIHCLDIVDLDHYYAKYHLANSTLTWAFRVLYQNLYRRLKKYGFSKTHSLLDYGCGANGLFVQHLRQQGFANCYGYDLYASQSGFGNPTILQRKPFDYILLQDVIEHVEDPNALLSELNSLLAPGGYILIGTPNAANLDLNQPTLSDHYNMVHVPYHLHVYTRESLELLGCRQGWEPVDFFGPYQDTLWPGLNTRAYNVYQRLFDGSVEVLFEPIKPGKMLTSYRFMSYVFYSIFGYWLSFRNEMAVMFHKKQG